MADQILIEYKVEIEGLKSQLSAMEKKLNEVEASAKKSATGAQKSFESAGASIKSTLKDIAVAAGLAFGTQQLISFGKEAVKLAAQGEGIRKAFNKLNDPNLLNNLREATKGTVSDLELMKSAVKANNFKLPLDQLAGLFKFAQQRAQETGESVDYLTESIVLGISRKSIPILDNLGISSQQIQKEFKKTGDFAKAVGNIVSSELQQQGDVALTTADKIAKLNSTWENLKETIGNFLINAGDDLLNAYDVLSGKKSADDLAKGKIFELANKELQKQSQEVLAIAGKSEKDRLEQIKNTENEIEKIKKEGKEKDTALGVETALFRLKNAQKLLSDLKNLNKKAQVELSEEELKAIKEAQEKALEDEKLLRDLRTELIADERKREKVALSNKLDDDLALHKNNSELLLQLRENYRAGLIEIDKKYDEKEKAENEKAFQDAIAETDKWLQNLTDAENISRRQRKEEKDKADKEELEAEKRKAELIKQIRSDLYSFESELASDFGTIVNNINQAQLQEYQDKANKEQEVLNAQFESGLITRADYDQKTKTLEDKRRKEEAELRRKAFEQEKQLSLIKIAISTAQGIANALEGDPYTVAYRVAFAAAIGAAQLAAVASQPTPKFAKGVVGLKGKGSETSDDIVARLSRGESVITAKATKEDKGLFEAFNKGVGKKYIQEFYIAPALKDKSDAYKNKKESGFASNLAKSLMLNSSSLNDKNIINELRNNRQLERENVDKLIKAISKQQINPRSIV